MKSRKVRSPLYTLAIYLPNGKASITVIRKVTITPNSSVRMILEFLGFQQNIQQVDEYRYRNDKDGRHHGLYRGDAKINARKQVKCLDRRRHCITAACARCRSQRRHIKMEGISPKWEWWLCFATQFIFFYFPVKGGQPDVEETRGLGLVAAGMIEDTLNMKFFDAGQIEGRNGTG